MARSLSASWSHAQAEKWSSHRRLPWRPGHAGRAHLDAVTVTPVRLRPAYLYSLSHSCCLLGRNILGKIVANLQISRQVVLALCRMIVYAILIKKAAYIAWKTLYPASVSNPYEEV